MIRQLEEIRERVFKQPRISLGNKKSYALNLYTQTGFAYRDLRKNNQLEKAKELLKDQRNIQWYFLSGGNGILNALEAARDYQATFNRSIHYQRKIPFTGTIWRTILPKVCNEIFTTFHPEWVYIFGSQDYTQYIKDTYYWRNEQNITMFESTGSAGIHWLSPMISTFIKAVLKEDIHNFTAHHKKFNKQGEE